MIILMASIFRLSTAISIGIILATFFLQHNVCQESSEEQQQQEKLPLVDRINHQLQSLLASINYKSTTGGSDGRNDRTHLIALQNVKTLAVIELRQLPTTRTSSLYLRFFATQQQEQQNLLQLRDCTLFDMIKRKEEGKQFLERLAAASVESGGNTTFTSIHPATSTMLLNATEMCRLLWKYQEQPPIPDPYTLADLFSSFSRFLPGTQWCGPGDRAINYWDLGTKAEVDSCCREHDHCPVRLASRESAYGEVNSREFTTSWCECDQRFKQCLDESATDIGHKVWTLFAYFQAGCLERVDSGGNSSSMGSDNCRKKRLANGNDTICDEQFRIRIFPVGQR